uniref:Uncharacterized protein n=1 Tax=Populus trichocarpa TaxID=3694 RepID=U5FFI7_POPTR
MENRTSTFYIWKHQFCRTPLILHPLISTIRLTFGGTFDTSICLMVDIPIENQPKHLVAVYSSRKYIRTPTYPQWIA